MTRRRSHRNAQLLRLLAIVRDLGRRDGADVYELAANHRTAVRTIWRDLGALGEAGLPLVEERVGRRSRWRLVAPDSRRQLAGLATVAQYAALRTALASGGTAAASRSLTGLVERLDGALADTERRQLRGLCDVIGATGPGPADDAGPDLLVPIVMAAAEGRCCRVGYRAPGTRESTFEVLPLRVFGRDGATYVLVHHRREDTILTLALRRITRLVVLTQRGAPPVGFQPRRYVESLFGVHGGGELARYRLRFAAEVAPFIRERRWHPSQVLRRGRDGSVTLTFLCQESFEVSAWVASWRHHVTVLAPHALRAELRDLGRTLCARYAPPLSDGSREVERA